MSANRRVGIDVIVNNSEGNAAFAATSAEIGKMGDSAAASSAAAGTAFASLGSGVESNRALIDQLTAAIAQNRYETAQLKTAALDLSLVQNSSAVELAEITTQTKLLSVDSLNLAAIKARLAAEERQLSVSRREEAATMAAINAEAAATLAARDAENAIIAESIAETNAFWESLLVETEVLEANTAAVAANTAAHGASGAQLVRGTLALDRFAGASLGGARALGTLATVFSVASLAQIGFVVGAALVIDLLFKFLGPAQKKVELNDKLLQQDIALANSAQSQAEAQERHRIVEANLTTTLTQLDENMKKADASTRKYEEAQRNLEFWQKLTANGTKDLTSLTSDLTETTIRGSEALRGASEAVSKLQGARQTDTLEVEKNMKALEQQALDLHMGAAAMADHARNAGVDEEHIKKLTEALDDNHRALTEWGLAAENVKIRSLDLTATHEGEIETRARLMERINGEIAARKSEADVLAANRNAIEQQIKAIKDNIEIDVAAGKVKGTQAAQQAELNKRIAEGKDGLAEWVAKIHAADEAHKNWTAKVKVNTEALKENALAQKAAAAMAANEPDTVDKKAAQFKAETDKLRGEYKIRGDLTRENEELIRTIEVANLTTVANLRIKHEEEIQARLRDMRSAGASEGLARLKEDYAKALDEDQKFLRQRLSAEETEARMEVDFRGREAANYTARVHDYFDKMVKDLITVQTKGNEVMKKLDADRVKDAEAGFHEQAKEFEKMQQQIVRLTDQILKAQSARGGKAPNLFGIDPALVQKDVELLNKLGLTVADVDKHFGSASKSEEQLRQRLIQLDQEAQNGVTFFGQLTNALQVAANQMGATKTAAEEMEQSMASGIKTMESGIMDAFAGITAGTESFGQAMKKMTLDLISQLAQQWGEYFIAKGIADIFFDPPLGGAEIAGGTALMALAGVMKGLAGTGTSASAGTSAGASTSSGGATPGSSSIQQRAPIFLPINASGQKQGPQPVFVILDKSGTQSFLAGQGVVTSGSLSRDHKRQIEQIARKAIQKPN
jgi:hypothetical protein